MFPQLFRFSKDEFTEPDMLDTRLLYMLDSMVIEETRHIPNLVFITHCDFRKNDSGEHGMYRAVDGHFESNGKVLPVFTQFLIVLRYNFTGVGFYPYWKRPGVHADVRPILLTGRRATWWRDKDGTYRKIEDYLL